MSYKYITVPQSLRLSELRDNDFCLAPSKYTRFSPDASVEFDTLYNLCKESAKKIQAERHKMYAYSEIGDINVSAGNIGYNSYFGIDIPCDKPKELKQNDIVLSTVRTYRGGVGFVFDNVQNRCCSPAMLVIREVNSRITREYLFAVLRTDFFIEQILGFQNRGMYPRLDKKAMQHILIPIPKQKDVIPYVTALVQAYLQKLSLIEQRYNSVLTIIESELLENQGPASFKFENPTLNEIEDAGRLDTNLYRKDFKSVCFLVTNYKFGSQTIFDFGFKLSRGQNLQVSNIGTSVYSSKPYDNFYTLMLPKFLSKYGTVDVTEYLGNPRRLKTLEKGDLIFGAEGFEKGRSIVIVEQTERTITNIHGITIKQKEHDLTKAIFIKCFLDFLRSKGLIDLFAVGGNGGSLAQRYWDYIPFPKFPSEKQEQIARLYYNEGLVYDVSACSLSDFLQSDDAFNSQAGIHQLDKTAKQLKERLNVVVDAILGNREVDTTFKF